MKKSHVTAIIFIALFALACYCYRSARPVKLPKKDVFLLELSCEETVHAGEATQVDVEFSNTGEYDYNITFSDDLFEVLVDGKPITPQDDGEMTVPIAHGETVSGAYDVTLDRVGLHKITVNVVINVEDDSAESREYRYQRNTKLQVSD